MSACPQHLKSLKSLTNSLPQPHWVHSHKNSNAQVECPKNNFSHFQCATSQSHSCALRAPPLRHFPSPIRCAVFAKRVGALPIGICPTSHQACPRFVLFLVTSSMPPVAPRVAQSAPALPVRYRARVAVRVAHWAARHRPRPRPLAQMPAAPFRRSAACRTGGSLWHPAHRGRVFLAASVHDA